MDLEKIRTKLLLGKPILFKNSFIHQPTINEIDDITEEKFQTIILPFSVNLEVVNIPEEYKKDLKIYDLFFVPSILNIEGTDMILYLFEGLRFFFKTEEVILNDDNSIIIDNKTVINRDNFEELQDVILKISCNKRLELPKEKVFKSEAQKKIHDSLQKARQKYRKKKKIEGLLSTVINELVHEDSEFTYQNICKFTLWQLINSLSVMRIKDEYKSNMQLIGSGGITDTSKMNLNHWKERITNEIE